MFKKSYLRVAAVLVCLAFLVSMAPALNCAEKKSAKSAAALSLKQSVHVLGFLFPLLGSLIDNLSGDSKDKELAGKEPSLGLISKPTGDAPSTGGPVTKD